MKHYYLQSLELFLTLLFGELWQCVFLLKGPGLSLGFVLVLLGIAACLLVCLQILYLVQNRQRQDISKQAQS